MKIVKRIVPFLIVAVILNFIFYFTLTIGGYAHIYDTALAWFTEPCDIRDDNFAEFELMEGSLESDSLFYFEVKQGHALTLDFMLNAVKYYSREINARYIVGEFGFAASQYLNRYLAGEGDALRVLFENSSGDIRTEEFLAFVDAVKEYNLKLSERRQLEFVGIGVGEKDFTALYLDSLYEAVSEKRQSEDIRSLFNSDLRETDPDAYFAAIRDDHAESSQPYRELFADKYGDFSCALGEYFADRSRAVDYMTARLVDEYNRSVGGKFVVFVTDVSLYESVQAQSSVIFERICLGRLIYADDYSFGLDGEASDVYTIDDRFLGLFEWWRSRVHSIAGRRFEGYRYIEREDPPLIFVALDMSPTTEVSEVMIEPEDTSDYPAVLDDL